MPVVVPTMQNELRNTHDTLSNPPTVELDPIVHVDPL
jgi:hypothetical protein